MSVQVKGRVSIEDTLGVEYKIRRFTHTVKTCQMVCPNGQGKCWRPRGHVGPHARMDRGNWHHEEFRWFCGGVVYTRRMLTELRKQAGITHVEMITEVVR